MANPSTSPEDVVLALLTANPSLGLTTTPTRNVFGGPPKPASSLIPRNAVFCYSLFSFMPKPYLGNAKDYRDFRITIFIRHETSKFETGQALMRAIWQRLQRANVSAYTGYVGCLMAEADGTYIGVDDEDNHRWTMTARLLYTG